MASVGFMPDSLNPVNNGRITQPLVCTSLEYTYPSLQMQSRLKSVPISLLKRDKIRGQRVDRGQRNAEAVSIRITVDFNKDSGHFSKGQNAYTLGPAPLLGWLLCKVAAHQRPLSSYKRL